MSNWNSNWLTTAVAEEVAYDKGYSTGKQIILDEVDDILARCAHDNGAMIVKALKELKKKYKRR